MSLSCEIHTLKIITNMRRDREKIVLLHVYLCLLIHKVCVSRQWCTLGRVW